MAAFNSNIYWWYYALNFDKFNHKDYMIFGFVYHTIMIKIDFIINYDIKYRMGDELNNEV